MTIPIIQAGSSDEPSRVPLLHGHAIPRMGLGTWPMLDQECTDAVREAIDVGYRLIDTSFQYQNEEAVGRGVSASGIARSNLFITSKFNKKSHSIDGVQRAYDDSLRWLNVDYLDLFLCHWPVPTQGKYVDAWEGLVKLLEGERVKAIGVSNFKPAHLKRIIEDWALHLAGVVWWHEFTSFWGAVSAIGR